MLESAENIFYEMVKKFPAWMSIGKRPMKSVSGKFFLSSLEERNDLNEALENLKKSFFLTHYIETGIEEDIISVVYTAPIDDKIEALIEPSLEITTDTNIFLSDRNNYGLLQDGYIILHELPDNGMVYYVIDDATYSAKLTKYFVWNIFDEYALFLGLERYENETNTQLAQRCLAVFKNPTNSTPEGLQNTIINALMNDMPIERDDIIIETPNEENIYLDENNYGSIYENLAQFNRDMFRTKRFDFDRWEYPFRQSDWLPHAWNVLPKIYQDGVGQLDDLKVGCTNIADDETTDVILYGYVKSPLLIDQYIHENQLKRTMVLKLQKYLDTLKAVAVDYKITARDVEKIDTDKIKLESFVTEKNRETYYLADLITSSSGLSVLKQNNISSDGIYTLKFFPNNVHDEFHLKEVTCTDKNGNSQNLIHEDSRFKMQNGMLEDTYSLLHLTKLNQAVSFENLTDTFDGIMLGKGAMTGKISMDITGMGGKSLSYEIESSFLPDITYNGNFVNYSGFTINEDQNILTAQTPNLNSSIDIDVECAEIQFEFLAAENVANQGSITVNIKVNDGTDIINSGIWSSPRIYHRKFDRLTHVEIHIQKSSSNPVSIGYIKAARYDVEFSFDEGSLVRSILTKALPNFDGKNILHMNIKNYDSSEPILKYIHVGNDTMNNSVYEIKNVLMESDSTLDISSNWRVELYRDVDGIETLLDANYNTKSIYRNNTSHDLMAAVNVNNYDSITESSVPIRQTVYFGEVTPYITIHPGESLREIIISGEKHNVKESYSLSSLLNKNLDDEVYVSYDVEGFIVRNEQTHEERMARISRDSFSEQSTNFTFVGLPSTMTGYFSLDNKNDKHLKADKTSEGFFYSWLELNQSGKYVAHNQSLLYTSELTNISVIDSWTPTLDTAKLMFYTIQVVNNDNYKIEVLFEKTDDNKIWSLGKKTLMIAFKNTYGNAESYNSEIFNLTEDYIVSASIPFEGERQIAGETQELARFIITPPEGMQIEYVEEIIGQNFNISNDDFTKLWYSNVGEIISIDAEDCKINPSQYELKNREGIVQWLDTTLRGKTVRIIYSYKPPKYIVYKSFDTIYKNVPYSIDAYKLLDEVPTLKNLSANDSVQYKFNSATPDKIIAKCTNNNFIPSINSDTVTVDIISSKNVLSVKPGYYYDGEEEYYFFNNQHSEAINKLNNIELYNVSRTEDQYIFVSETSNYLLDTMMRGQRLETLCHIDCAAHREITGISKFGIFTACDTYSNWFDFEMNVERIPSSSADYLLSFNPKNKNSYAMTEITRGVEPNTIITLEKIGDIECQIFKEFQTANGGFTSSIIEYIQFLMLPTD